MKSAALLCLILFLPFRSRAEDTSPAPVAGVAVETGETQLARQVSDALRQDAELRQSLSERILKSSLADQLSSTGDSNAPGQIDGWIARHSDDAAQLQIGFAQDDLNGTHAFEHSLHERVIRYFELNPKREQGILGRLERAGSESKFILRPEEKLNSEEQHELLKHIFEGSTLEKQHVTSSQVDQSKNAAQSGISGTSGTPVLAGTGMYDRLSALNVTGYSPEVLALQNSLNAQKVPGAPPISETGRLDYATLAFPFYLLRYDLDRLKPASQTNTHSDSPRNKDREKALALAAHALQNFELEVEKSKQPSKITAALLKSLGRQQKEAARWITAASLEGDLEHLESLPTRWPEEVLEKIKTAPVDDEIRQNYLSEGGRLLDRLAHVKEADAKAIEALESPDFLSRWEDAQKQLAQAAPLRRDLPQDMGLYARLPYLLADAFHPKPAWKTFFEYWSVRFAQGTDYANRITRENQKWAALESAFGQVASGDYTQAKSSLAKAQV